MLLFFLPVITRLGFFEPPFPPVHLPSPCLLPCRCISFSIEQAWPPDELDKLAARVLSPLRSCEQIDYGDFWAHDW